MNVVVVGGGKMGLPLGCQFADNGAHVTVCDVNRELVAKINAGVAPFDEPGLAEYLARNVAAARLMATSETTPATRGADVVVIIVPALLSPDRTIDYTNLKLASRAVSAGLHPGTLVSYETTVPVGGCRNELVPVLEGNGLRAGVDFYVSFSPERVKSQRVFERLQTTPKIVGGFDHHSAERAVAFYSKYLGAEVINLGTLEAAEFVKLAGMLYRDVNIALANELAAFCEQTELDFGLFARACNTNGEAHLLEPGIGVGGHCTPVYPYFMIEPAERAGTALRLAEYARETNERQPARHVDRLAAALGGLESQTAHLLGLGFRPGVKEDAYSPAYALRDELVARGARVTLEDPLYAAQELEQLGFAMGRTGNGQVAAVILNTAHPEFEHPDFAAWHASGVRVVLDGRNVWSRAAAESAGLLYLGVGTPDPAVPANSRITLTKPALSGAEARAADRAVRSGWVTQGPRVAEFERAVAEYCGTLEGVAVSSGTTALHLALLTLGVGPGDEVICPSLSFIATANSIRYTGATPVFADVDPQTYNLDPDAAEAAITPRTKAIMVVHQMGLPADIDRFLSLGDKYGIKILEDAACALGSRYKGQPIGGHTEMACFSYHPRKVVTTGEGGMITTNNRDYARNLRLLRQHGMSVPDTVRHHANRLITEEYVCLGYNYRMSDIHAAIGIEQMKKLDWIVGRRRQLAARYTEALLKHPWLRPPHVPEYAEPNYQSYAVQLSDDAPIARNVLLQNLLDQGISAKPGIMPAHLEPAYARCATQLCLHASLTASSQTLLLPLYPAMTDADCEYVFGALVRIVEGNLVTADSGQFTRVEGRLA